ncbi:MAG: hypothetical protein C4548_03910 [Desulfobacteraceae bacterium]|nr:MAG: hypothetical protein C4548_03910 [Desulfobacteraceae bacterium]
MMVVTVECVGFDSAPAASGDDPRWSSEPAERSRFGPSGIIPGRRRAGDSDKANRDGEAGSEPYRDCPSGGGRSRTRRRVRKIVIIRDEAEFEAALEWALDIPSLSSCF